MFRFKKKDAWVSARAFNYFLAKKYFVPYLNGESHFKTNRVSNTNETDSIPDAPYFWTSDLTHCVGIALIEKKSQAKTAAVGLYHSNSEHSASTKKNLVKSIEAFIEQSDDVSAITVVVSFNVSIFSEDYFRKSDMKQIKSIINECCKTLGKAVIPDENFVSFNGDASFYVTAEGEFGSFLELLKEKKMLMELEKMMLNHTYELGLFHRDDHNGKQVSHGVKKILNILSDASSSNFHDILFAFRNVMDIAKEQLLAWHSIFNSQKDSTRVLYLKIVGWDPLLNRPSELMLNDWLLQHELEISPVLKKNVLSFNQDGKAVIEELDASQTLKSVSVKYS